MAYEISSSNTPAEPETNDILDRRAMRLLPDWAKDVVREVSHRHDVPVRDIMGPSRTRVAATARHEAIYRVKLAVGFGRTARELVRPRSLNDHPRAQGPPIWSRAPGACRST